MAEENSVPVGTVGWMDLTVDDAPGVRDFYRTVVGWSASDVNMGEYADFTMIAPATGEAVAGVCHARGSNAGMPPQWMIYITVADLEASAATCREHGGEVVVEPRAAGGGRFCVIRDPAGAICGLYQAAV